MDPRHKLVKEAPEKFFIHPKDIEKRACRVQAYPFIEATGKRQEVFCLKQRGHKDFHAAPVVASGEQWVVWDKSGCRIVKGG